MPDVELRPLNLGDRASYHALVAAEETSLLGRPDTSPADLDVQFTGPDALPAAGRVALLAGRLAGFVVIERIPQAREVVFDTRIDRSLPAADRAAVRSALLRHVERHAAGLAVDAPDAAAAQPGADPWDADDQRWQLYSGTYGTDTEGAAALAALGMRLVRTFHRMRARHTPSPQTLADPPTPSHSQAPADSSAPHPQTLADATASSHTNTCADATPHSHSQTSTAPSTPGPSQAPADPPTRHAQAAPHAQASADPRPADDPPPPGRQNPQRTGSVAGPTLRAVADADLRTVHRIATTAMADHWAATVRDFEPWLAHRRAHEAFDQTLWRLAELDGSPVGVCLCDRSRMADGYGYVQTLAVLRPARGRGIAKALLLDAFARDAAAGLRGTELDVDAANRTGALRLYQGVGMRSVRSVDVFLKPL